MSQLTLKKSTAMLDKIRLSDCVLFFSFMFVATSARSSLFLYPGLSFFYQRNRKEWIIASLGTLVGSCFTGFFGFYRQILLITFFILLICLIQLIHQNLFSWFPALCGLNCILASLVIGTSLTHSLILGFGSAMLCRKAQADWLWIDPQFKVSETMLGILVMALPYLALSCLPLQIGFPLCILAFVLLTSLVHSEIFILLLAGFAISVPIPQSAWILFVAILLLNVFRQEPLWMRCGIFLVPLIWVVAPWQNIASAFLFFGIYLMFPSTLIRTKILCEQRQTITGQRLETKKRTILHQLTQFSRIFDLIADYYRETRPSETMFLQGMSQALETVSMQMKQSVAEEEEISDKIVNLLEGYHFEVRRVQVMPWQEGPLELILDFAELTKVDLEEVVLPLLHMVIDKDLKVTNFQRNRVFYSGSRLVLSTSQPSVLKTKLYCLKADPDYCGDTGAVFQNGQMTICTISDGMGIGQSANHSSHFVTQVLQRMISASMPVEAAVQSINALLHADQKEQFATLDFLCYDQRKHQAYLCKSGACPTYFVRDGKMMEINGESLPIGIIQKIETDCFLIDCKQDDFFVMSSDGVDKLLLEQWIQQGSLDKLSQRVEASLKSMEEMGIEDDITLLLARVGKS